MSSEIEELKLQLQHALEENKRLTLDVEHANRGKKLESELKVEMSKLLQQATEELEQANRGKEITLQSHYYLESQISAKDTELEQVKSERDYALRGSTCDACRGVIGENDKLRTELSAKDKVLEWYADTENWDEQDRGILVIPARVDSGKQARTILSKYGGTP